MKLLLISPSHKFRKKLRAIKIPQLSLHILASLTPNDVDITVIDEEIREIDFSLDFDLVGISCMTATANRTYQLSDMFRQRGSKVVLGGIHPTILPQEAIEHADAVVISHSPRHPIPRADWDISKYVFLPRILGGLDFRSIQHFNCK
ncbi:MAG: cobalamin-dependent protein [Syntrophales bacterium]